VFEIIMAEKVAKGTLEKNYDMLTLLKGEKVFANQKQDIFPVTRVHY
jgi:hypothetical protein